MTSDPHPPPSSIARVEVAAARLGIAIEVKVMERPTRTAEEAAAACSCDVGQIVKSLVYAGRDSGAPHLLLVSGANRVDEDRAALLTGEPLVRPDAKRVRAWTGFAIGGIPPFGHATPLPTVLDEALLAYDRVWAAAGTPNAVFAVDPSALRDAVGAGVGRVA